MSGEREQRPGGVRERVRVAAREHGLPARLAERVAALVPDVVPDAAGEPGVAPAARHAVVGCDLDRTLIYSRAALALDGQPLPALEVVEMLDGRPQSFWTVDARRVLAALMRAATFVPTTTRTLAQYARVRLPGEPRYAIAANGGHLLVDGAPCRRWAAHVHEQLALSAPLREVVAHLRAATDPGWVRKHRVADDLFAYLVVERELVPDGFVGELTQWCAQRGWVVSMQGRKVYAVPAGLTKSAAIAEVARRTGAHDVLAAGDSLLDADLLLAAGAGVRPAHGELHTVGWSAGHVAVTERAGVLGGEEIVLRLLARVLGARNA